VYYVIEVQERGAVIESRHRKWERAVAAVSRLQEKYDTNHFTVVEERGGETFDSFTGAAAPLTRSKDDQDQDRRA
jgi:hypothetical protein